MKQNNILFQNFHYSIVDSLSTMIVSHQFVDNEKIISMAGAPSGNYFISLVDGRGNKKSKKDYH